jgi:hypothetical protein
VSALLFISYPYSFISFDETISWIRFDALAQV